MTTLPLTPSLTPSVEEAREAAIQKITPWLKPDMPFNVGKEVLDAYGAAVRAAQKERYTETFRLMLSDSRRLVAAEAKLTAQAEEIAKAFAGLERIRETLTRIMLSRKG